MEDRRKDTIEVDRKTFQVLLDTKALFDVASQFLKSSEPDAMIIERLRQNAKTMEELYK